MNIPWAEYVNLASVGVFPQITSSCIEKQIPLCQVFVKNDNERCSREMIVKGSEDE